MIPDCREVGVVSGNPCGDTVYFLTRYLLRPSGDSFDLFAVDTDPGSPGLMRPVSEGRLLARADEVAVHPDRVRLWDRALLVRLARASGRRCTVFTGLDEHVTFVLDPESEPLLEVHVYDIEPPRPNLSAGIREMEALGLFGDLSVTFCHHVRDIRGAGASVYPCRAAGFPRTLDADRVEAGETVACCTTGRELVEECYGVPFVQDDTCPLGHVNAEPFVARCCRSERRGLREVRGFFGTVVHWGDSPAQIFDAVRALAAAWRMHDADRGR
ncbi:MAG: hypothetical protein GXY82_08105 [Methanospirillum sp.]|nr:hypothetical protein [Methanospirillum sp.]